MLGNSYKEIGDLKENLILKTAGKIKVLIGKRFIDLIDALGNINSSNSSNLINEISSEQEIIGDGFYILNGNVILSFGGNLIVLAALS